jgi:hypothetical protein
VELFSPLSPKAIARSVAFGELTSEYRNCHTAVYEMTPRKRRLGVARFWPVPVGFRTFGLLAMSLSEIARALSEWSAVSGAKRAKTSLLCGERKRGGEQAG